MPRVHPIVWIVLVGSKRIRHRLGIAGFLSLLAFIIMAQHYDSNSNMQLMLGVLIMFALISLGLYFCSTILARLTKIVIEDIKADYFSENDAADIVNFRKLEILVAFLRFQRRPAAPGLRPHRGSPARNRSEVGPGDRFDRLTPGNDF
jgi:hypothetical protein